MGGYKKPSSSRFNFAPTAARYIHSMHVMSPELSPHLDAPRPHAGPTGEWDTSSEPGSIHSCSDVGHGLPREIQSQITAWAVGSVLRKGSSRNLRLSSNIHRPSQQSLSIGSFDTIDPHAFAAPRALRCGYRSRTNLHLAAACRTLTGPALTARRAHRATRKQSDGGSSVLESRNICPPGQRVHYIDVCSAHQPRTVAGDPLQSTQGSAGHPGRAARVVVTLDAQLPAAIPPPESRANATLSSWTSQASIRRP